MGKTKNPLYIFMLIFNIIFIIPGAVVCIQPLIGADAGIFMRLAEVFAILSCVFSFIYVVRGYSKGQAWAYKLFIASFALSSLFALLHVSVSAYNVAEIILLTLHFGLLLFTVASRDMGQKVSLVICAVIIALAVTASVITFIIQPGIVRGGDANGTLIVLMQTAVVLLSAEFGLITVAKYIDKSVRGTK